MTIVRAHQVQIEGYKMHRWDGPSSFPFVITIFSAPNYCDYYSNKGSVLILEEGNVSIKQFDSVEHPYNLPDQIDIFTWSMPFLIDKVLSMILMMKDSKLPLPIVSAIFENVSLM
jgi:serine/threonine-protein phosphatase 2B catalytic subunit